VRSIRYQALWASVLILSGSLGTRGAQLYSDLLTFTSFASLLFNTLTIAGLFALRKKRPEMARPYRVAGYPWIPLAFLVVAIFFLIFIAAGDPRNSGFGLLIILAGTPLYWVLSVRAKRETGSGAGPRKAEISAARSGGPPPYSG
jgi:APA family basic amino acid/polyamine antiporter